MKAAHSLFSFACTHLIRKAAEGLRGGEGCEEERKTCERQGMTNWLGRWQEECLDKDPVSSVFSDYSGYERTEQVITGKDQCWGSVHTATQVRACVSVWVLRHVSLHTDNIAHKMYTNTRQQATTAKIFTHQVYITKGHHQPHRSPAVNCFDIYVGSCD